MAINLFDFSQNQGMSIDTQRYPQKPVFNLQNTTNNSLKQDVVPYTTSGTNIQKGRGATNLFSDEQSAYDNMIRDGIDELKAKEVITQRRQSMLGQINPKEVQALQKMIADGLDSKTAVEIVKEQRKYEEQKWAKENPIANIGRGIYNIPVGVASLAAEQGGNILDFATMGKAGFKEDVERIKAANQYLEGSVGATTGRYIAGIGETLAVGPTKLAPTLLGRTAQGAGVGAVTGAAMPVLEKGSDATTGDIVTGGAIGGTVGAVATPVLEKVAIPAVVGTLQKGKKYGTALIKGGTQGLSKSVGRDVKALGQTLKKGTTIPVTENTTRQIPQAIIKRDLGFTPTERANIEKITGRTEGDYVLSKNLGGKDKEELAQYFDKQANDMYNGISEKLKSINIKVKSNSATDALNDMLDQLTSKPKYARAYAQDIEAIQDMLNRGQYTLDELNNIRRAYDKVNTGIYTAKGEIRSGLDAEIDAKVRRGINNVLQKEAKKYGVNVAEMNRELRAGITMKEALLRRLSQEERNNFIGLQDLGVSAILSGGNPATAIATIGAKKYGEKLAPSLAQKLYNLNKSKNVSSRMSRGNTIITNTKSSKLGLASNNRSNMVKPSEINKNSRLLKPKSILSPSEALKVNKTKLETTLKGATSNNINEVAQSVAKPKVLLKKEVKPDVNFESRQQAILEQEREKFLNFLDRQKEGSKNLTKISSIIENNPKYKELLKKSEDIKLKNEKAIMTIYGELEGSKAGSRVFLESEYGGSPDVVGISSTFPKYLPEKSRTTPIVTRIIKHLNDGDVPKYNNRNIYDGYIAVLKRFKNLGGDFKIFLINQSEKIIDEIAEKVGAKINLVSSKEGIGVEKTALLKGSDDLVLRQGQPPISKNGDSSGKVARERFNIQNLEKLGAGSDRDVYDLGNNQVLKVVKSARGLEQTRQGTDFYLQETGIVPKVFEQGDNYVVVEKVKQFKDMSKEERKIINDFIEDMASLRPGYRQRADMGKIYERLEKYGWEELANYDMDTFGWGDIRKANLGIKNGKPVLIDEGTINLTQTIDNYKGVKNLDDYEFRDVYTRSKAIKKALGDIDKNTMYNIGGVIIGGGYLYNRLYGDNTEV